MKVYLDVCCLNRPFDDQTQPRIRLEAEAVLLIIAQFEAGHWQWINSEVIAWEVSQIPDPERRHRIQTMILHTNSIVEVGSREVERAREIEMWNIAAFDALHLACAESGEVDVFLTTDDKLVSKANNRAGQLRVRVENPLAWLRKVIWS